MNKKFRLRSLLVIIWTVLSLLIFLTLFNKYQLNVSADASNNEKSNNADFNNALKTAPKGLTWDNNDFDIANFSDAISYRKQNPFYNGLPSLGDHTSNPTANTNNVDIIKTKNENNSSVISMTNNTWQTGAVWSNKKNYNYFDISHEQKASMWLYLGRTKENDSLPGDGMAFVIQNDPNGENAIALSADGYPVNGQSLGVWGADWNYHNKDPQRVANSAIQNSWALEFDTFINYQTDDNQIKSGEGVAFDTKDFQQSQDRHIAGNYPALKSTYNSANQILNYFTMNHINPQKAPHYTEVSKNKDLVDSKWHHVTIQWEPIDSTKGILTYIYNDKDPNTGSPQTDYRITSSFQINTDNFYKSDGQTIPDKKNTKLYWGFTGSTGRYSENNLLIFESIPSFVDAEATPSIYDESQGGKEINNDYNEVDPNSTMKYRFDLNYKGWEKGWNNIQAKMNVPQHIHFTSGTITYGNSAPQPIPDSVFSDPNASQLSYTLPQKLDSNNRNATIDLYGNTDKYVPTKLTVPSMHASFEGDNLITDANSLSYTIRPRNIIIDSESTNPIKVEAEQDVNVPGEVISVGNNPYPDYANMTVHQILNGTESDLGKIVDPTTHKFSININHNNLNYINTLLFYVTDKDNNKSNTIYRQIDKNGLLQFGNIQQNISFKDINSPYNPDGTNPPYKQARIISRAGNWFVNVVDNRQMQQKWFVQAQADPLVNQKTGKKSFNGNIVFKDKKGILHELNQPLNVASGIKSTEGSQTSDIIKQWSADNGILLAMTANTDSGTYTSKINWTLSDSIANA